MVYDFLYLITSYDRYDKLKSLIDNILKFKHNFKIIVIDDCSKDERYSDLKNYNEKLIYLRNQENYGKEKFWLTIDTIFKKASEYNFKNGVMLQDDFELITNFENLLEKRIVNNNEIIRLFTQNNIIGSNWGYENWIDGAYCAPFSFFKSLNFEIFPIRLLNPNGSSGVGNQLTERLNRLKYKVVNYGSMVEHIGNFDSKMHPEHRKKQPLFANFKPNNYKLSIIIPTYNNVNFLPECFDSILNSIKDLDCEILVGVDNCEETLKYINNNSFDKRFNFYFFNKNLGPYIIKNTLVTLSSSDKILFFDSDDIMMEELIQDVLEYLNTFKMYKPMYIDFTNKNDVKDVINIKTNKFGEGVFAVNKQTFLELNGFEGWRCAADSDFMGRFYRKNFNFKLGRSISFLRRVHSNSLTSHPDTGLSSQLRGYYHKLSKRNNKTVCEILNIHNFTEIEVNYNLDKKYEEFLMRKNIAEQVISKVLSGGVNKSEINYDKINEVISNKGYYNPKTSVKPIRENLPKNRNEIIQKKNGSNTEQIKKIIPTKQNRRKDLPNIFSKKNK